MEGPAPQLAFEVTAIFSVKLQYMYTQRAQHHREESTSATFNNNALITSPVAELCQLHPSHDEICWLAEAFCVKNENKLIFEIHLFFYF